jgi:type I restriction enzyme, R subunit
MTRAFAICCTLDEALVYREEIAFFQVIKAILIKHDSAAVSLSDQQRDHALRQIVSRAMISDDVIDIFVAAGLKKPNIGVLSEEFLNEVRMMPQRNLAVELLERLMKDDIKSRFATNVVQNRKFTVRVRVIKR